MWAAGAKLGRFVLEHEIGQGSHGVVFAARDTVLDAQVAVKILHPWLMQDTTVRDRFKRELLLARRVSHPGICRLFDLHDDSGAFFITMEFVQGSTLLNILKVEGRVRPARAVRILRGVCRALAAAHQVGVIHRDLKPANIIVRANDEPMILDFGTATAQDVSRVTRPGTAVGSMRFIAPEVFTGESPTISTDVYSLGVVAYVLLAGKLPYNAAAGAIEMLDQINRSPPQGLETIHPDIPKALADAVARAMSAKSANRFTDALAFESALAAAMGESVSSPQVVAPGLAQGAPARDASELPTRLDHSPKGPTHTPAVIGNGLSGHNDIPKDVPTEAAAENVTVSLRPNTAISKPPEATRAVGSLAPNGSMGPTTDPAHRNPSRSTAEAPVVLSSDDDAATTTVTPAKHLSLDSHLPMDRSGEIAAIRSAVDDVSSDGFFNAATAQMPTQDSSADAAETTVATGNLPERSVKVMRVDVTEIMAERAAALRSNRRAPLIGVLLGACVVAAGVAAVLALRPGSDLPPPTTDAGIAAANPAPNPVRVDPAVLPPVQPAVAALADAGALALATDAGPAVDDDNPELFEANDDREDPPVRASTPKGTRTSSPSAMPASVATALRAAKQRMAQKGFIPGDVSEADRVLQRAWAARSRPDDAVSLARQAEKLYDDTAVDRAFVLQKLQRFNAKYATAKARNARVADRVEPLSRAAAEAFGKGQYPSANKKLNGAFAAMGK